ncbi:DUF998 domain-containing protein [Catenuloplanes japonicus]|uniref:DUF998 domain-containing protein n=1 Tax=Catenuloplanes japonicus TaxID=33876 RepID=UPI00069235AF|nr:DUF998 domain-containing protein [Catenuloplanes japonicus]
MFLAGAAAPLVLLGGLLADGVTRAGYAPIRHGVSQLTLGDRGGTARLLFVVCGALLTMAALTGARRRRYGPRWQWRLLVLTGAGLMLAGLFPTDPALGYPPGALDGVSMSGVVHQVGGTMLFGGVTAAAVVAGRSARRRGERRWATVCFTVACATAGLACAAGVVFRLMQRDIVGRGPAGLLELLSMGCGLCWVAGVMVHDPSPQARIPG